MNKVYKDIYEYLKETFHDYFDVREQDDESEIQSYIQQASIEFTNEIREIIATQRQV